MKHRLILLTTAFIWGSTFIAQRMVADLIEPNSYNAVRFLLGALTLLPIMYFTKDSTPTKKPWLSYTGTSLLLGLFLACGSFLQQYGIAFTSASKAAFITALYIVLVPLAGIFLGQTLPYITAIGVVSSLAGAAALTLRGDLQIAWGDLALLIGTLFWTAHILLLNDLTHRFPCIKLAFGQFIACALISGLAAVLLESPTLTQIMDATIPIFWGGVLSVGLGFTGQLVGQRQVPPTQASLILSLEMVFAGLLGYLILQEQLSTLDVWGICLMSFGVILSQLPSSPRYAFRALYNPFYNKPKL